jgi:hypothetical protein
MGAMTNYLESGLLNHVLRSISLSSPTGLQIGLVGAFNQGNLESGILTDEISGGSYARIVYSANASSWISPYPIGNTYATHNTQVIEFAQATSDIGLASGVFILDSSSSNIIFYGQLQNPRNIRTGDQFVMPSGSLIITFD